MAKALAHVGGIAITPGVSKNRRLYTREAIAKMVDRAQTRIEAGHGIDITDGQPVSPLTQLTHHDAEDDSTKIIGRLTSMTLTDEGAARFTADIADTIPGRTIAQLLDTTDNHPPYLKGVSIRGAWKGPVKRVQGPDGDPAETADDLELDGLDYTRKPGVEAAQVDTFAWAKGDQAETTERVLITESVQEACVEPITEDGHDAGLRRSQDAADGAREALRVLIGERVTEADTPAVSKRGSGLSDDGGRAYADPGYQKDGKQRYDVSTKAKAKAAWSYVSQADNAKSYTPDQLKRVKGRIMKALRKFGVKTAKEAAGWSFEPFQISESLAEYYGDSSLAGSWCISADNGPVHVNLSCYGMDPADMDVILRAAADAASSALKALDPDMDGDMDVPGAPHADTDNDMESAPDDVTDLADRIAIALRSESTDALAGLLAEARDVPPAAAEAASRLLAAARTPAVETAPDKPPAPDAGPQEREEPAPMSEATKEAVAQAPAATPATAPAAVEVPEDLVAKYQKKLAKKEARKRVAAASPRPAKTEAAPAAPAVVAESDDERIARIVAAKVAELAPAATEAAPAAPAVTESEEDKISRLVEAQMVTIKQQLVAEGAAGIGRKGLSPAGRVNEHTARVTPASSDGEGLPVPAGKTADAMHEWDVDSFNAYAGVALTGYTLGDRAALLA